MAEEYKVKKIMSHIEEYSTVGEDDRLCDALRILKENYARIQAHEPGKYHKTLFVKNAEGKIVGKFSIFDLIRGLVPESARKTNLSHLHYRTISLRAEDASKQIEEIQKRFQWLDSSFFDLVKRETQKRVKDVMSPIDPLLEEEDTINKAVYLMFKENIRQPLVVREGKIVGVVNLIGVLEEVLKIAGDQCFWEGIV